MKCQSQQVRVGIVGNIFEACTVVMGYYPLTMNSICHLNMFTVKLSELAFMELFPPLFPRQEIFLPATNPTALHFSTFTPNCQAEQVPCIVQGYWPLKYLKMTF